MTRNIAMATNFVGFLGFFNTDVGVGFGFFKISRYRFWFSVTDSALLHAAAAKSARQTNCIMQTHTHTHAHTLTGI